MASNVVVNNILMCMFIVPPNNLAIRGSSNTPGELDTVIIECNVTANPPATITWLKRTSEKRRNLVNTSRIYITHQVTSTSRGPVTGSTLVINNVETADSGDFVCEARNSPSFPTVSTNFSITVICKSISHWTIRIKHSKYFAVS